MCSVLKNLKSSTLCGIGLNYQTASHCKPGEVVVEKVKIVEVVVVVKVEKVVVVVEVPSTHSFLVALRPAEKSLWTVVGEATHIHPKKFSLYMLCPSGDHCNLALQCHELLTVGTPLRSCSGNFYQKNVVSDPFQPSYTTGTQANLEALHLDGKNIWNCVCCDLGGLGHYWVQPLLQIVEYPWLVWLVCWRSEKRCTVGRGDLYSPLPAGGFTSTPSRWPLGSLLLS